MELAGYIFLLIIGLVLIIFGGDAFVDGVSWIAKKLGIPQFIIGATLVSFVTTLPEIIVSTIAAGEGKTDLAIGNAVGSVNANIALIMSLSIIFIPVAIKRKEYAFKFILFLISVVSLWLLSFKSKSLALWGAGISIILFVVFITENIIVTIKKYKAKFCLENTINIDEYHVITNSNEFALGQDGKIIKLKLKEKSSNKEIVGNVFRFIFGIGGIIGGAQLLVTYGEKFAFKVGVPSRIIAVTVIAIGTSLPELVTTITSIIKKKADLSVGNIIGANVIDITLILALCAFISGKPLPVNNQSLLLDFPFCIAAGAIAIIPTLLFGKFKRWQGIMLLGGYIAYIAVLATKFLN